MCTVRVLGFGCVSSSLVEEAAELPSRVTGTAVWSGLYCGDLACPEEGLGSEITVGKAGYHLFTRAFTRCGYD